jgi:FkbM family methyltransferase
MTTTNQELRLRDHVKRGIKDLLRPYKHHIPGLKPKLSWSTALTFLDVQPRVIFDIGVAFGTWELYKFYPEAFYHLIEPAEEARPYMEQIKRTLGGRCALHMVALSDTEGTVPFQVLDDLLGSTMMPEETFSSAKVVRMEEVVTRRFDRLFEHVMQPALVKIDVQGAELMVLKGMTGVLDQIAAVIVEVSTISTIKNGPEVHEVMDFMYQHGFVLADVIGLLRRPLDGLTAQLDLMFIPATSRYRQNRQWG